jgi:hypothetical protein
MSQSNSIRNGIIVVVAFVVAIWLGITIVTEQTETILKMGAVGLFLTCVFLGRKIWLLFIFFNAMAFPLIRGFSTAELGQVILVGFTFAIILMRRQPLNFKFTELEFWSLMVVSMIAQAYFRNPVGLNMFGAGSVGARPYFQVAVAFLASVVLGNIVVPAREIKWSMWATIIAWVMTPFLFKARGLGFGGGPSAGFSQGEFGTETGISQNSSFGVLSLSMAKILAAFRSPLRDIFHPVWGGLMLVSIALAAFSGYRNNVAAVGMFYLIALAYRGGFHSVVIASFLGALGLGVLALTNLAFPLPANIQRALSPFPGTWEKQYVKSADDSTEWRVDMWKEALFTKYWIRNKILGDGLGLTQREHKLLVSAEEGGPGMGSMSSGMTAQQEAMMITGGYHSGPVQCIRIVGYVGLLVVLIAMIRVAVHAHRQIRRCRGTEWYPLALFFGIPIIALPFLYVFVFGDFGRDVSATFLAIGMIRLLEKNLPLPPYVIRKREPFILMNQRNQAARVADGRF